MSKGPEVQRARGIGRTEGMPEMSVTLSFCFLNPQ